MSSVYQKRVNLNSIVRFLLLEAGNPAAKALSSRTELSTTVPRPAEEQCRLAIQAQEEDEQVKRGPKCKFQKASQYSAVQMVTATLS
jgi:hypothetical protein